MYNLNTIPDDILRLIFSNLERFELCNISYVSRNFRNIACYFLFLKKLVSYGMVEELAISMLNNAVIKSNDFYSFIHQSFEDIILIISDKEFDNLENNSYKIKKNDKDCFSFEFYFLYLNFLLGKCKINSFLDEEKLFSLILSESLPFSFSKNDEDVLFYGENIKLLSEIIKKILVIITQLILNISNESIFSFEFLEKTKRLNAIRVIKKLNFIISFLYLLKKNVENPEYISKIIKIIWFISGVSYCDDKNFNIFLSIDELNFFINKFSSKERCSNGFLQKLFDFFYSKMCIDYKLIFFNKFLKSNNKFTGLILDKYNITKIFFLLEDMNTSKVIDRKINIDYSFYVTAFSIGSYYMPFHKVNYKKFLKYNIILEGLCNYKDLKKYQLSGNVFIIFLLSTLYIIYSMEEIIENKLLELIMSYTHPIMILTRILYSINQIHYYYPQCSSFKSFNDNEIPTEVPKYVGKHTLFLANIRNVYLQMFSYPNPYPDIFAGESQYIKGIVDFFYENQEMLNFFTRAQIEKYSSNGIAMLYLTFKVFPTEKKPLVKEIFSNIIFICQLYKAMELFNIPRNAVETVKIRQKATNFFTFIQDKDIENLFHQYQVPPNQTSLLCLEFDKQENFFQALYQNVSVKMEECALTSIRDQGISVSPVSFLNTSEAPILQRAFSFNMSN